ncbi:MAG TPA: hypothetical protein VF461_18905 [Gemmatimonadaceae bacterium]
MRILWTFAKVVFGLALLIPLGIIVAATAFGILGVMIGLAVLALKLAVFGLVGYAVFRVVRHLIAPAPQPGSPVIRDLPPVDRHYEAAMRELDAELGHTSRT